MPGQERIDSSPVYVQIPLRFVYHKRSGTVEILHHLGSGWFRDTDLINRRHHVGEPGVSFDLSNGERTMPHPQPGMPSFFLVAGRATPVLSQKKKLVFFPWFKILREEGS
jgi:hypothetical protein